MKTIPRFRMQVNFLIFEMCIRDSSPVSCSFCGGAEEDTPLATAVYKNGKIFADTPEKRILNWDFRCFPNIYPVLSPVPDPLENQEIDLHSEPGYGFHEVIIESPLHGRRLEDFSDLEITGLMNVYRTRTCNYMTQGRILYVLPIHKFWESRRSFNGSLSQSAYCPSILSSSTRKGNESY